mmetsp:Transcript_7781/g.6876  ORF Transcript_7781/g.6876 Transcript_7781/m.6876 type:complete len:173 (-) Transcript_7781:31-549(-)
MNIIVSNIILWLSRSGHEWYLKLIIFGFTLLLVFRFLLSLIHILQNKWNMFYLNLHMKEIKRGVAPLPNRELSNHLIDKSVYFIPQRRRALDIENNLNQGSKIHEESKDFCLGNDKKMKGESFVQNQYKNNEVEIEMEKQSKHQIKENLSIIEQGKEKNNTSLTEIEVSIKG